VLCLYLNRSPRQRWQLVHQSNIPFRNSDWPGFGPLRSDRSGLPLRSGVWTEQRRANSTSSGFRHHRLQGPVPGSGPSRAPAVPQACRQGPRSRGQQRQALQAGLQPHRRNRHPNSHQRAAYRRARSSGPEPLEFGRLQSRFLPWFRPQPSPLQKIQPGAEPSSWRCAAGARQAALLDGRIVPK